MAIDERSIVGAALRNDLLLLFGHLLQVVSRTKLQFSVRHIEEFLPEFGYEDWVPITNHGLGHSMELENTFKKLFCHMFCYKRITKCKEMGILTKSVNNHYNCILSLQNQ